MEYDLNLIKTSINLKSTTTPKIPRSQTTEKKHQDEKLNDSSLRNKTQQKSFSISRKQSKEIIYKNALDTNIQVHIRV